MIKGYFCPVLHAHLPFVRHAEKEGIIAEQWLYEAITETYIPLLNIMNKLLTDNVDFQLTLSISPTLAEMLADELLQKRYYTYLQKSIELSDKEIKRTANSPQKNKTAKLYRYLLTEANYVFQKYNQNILQGFSEIENSGKLELITTAATHGYLPLFLTEEAVSAQIKTGINTFYKHFDKYPQGFWLPECGYRPGIDQHLVNNEIKYTFASSQGLLHSKPRPAYSLYAPIVTSNNVSVFGRDKKSSKQVWSADEGYPGDYNYREFYRDIGYELPYDYLKPYLPQGIRKDTGFKYYKITGETENKELYNYHKARKKAAEHADDFLSKHKKHFFYLEQIMDKPPLIVSPYDAELFGHWWFEGPAWLEYIFRKLDSSYPEIKAITPSKYLNLHPENQPAEPAESSWGYKGYHEVWINGRNDWIYRHLHEAELKMKKMVDDYNKFLCNNINNKKKKVFIDVLKQMERELLLAQSSDWAFIMKTGTMEEYAEKRLKDHLNNFFKLYKILNNKYKKKSSRKSIHQLSDENYTFLKKLQKNNNIFPDIDYNNYYIPKEYLHRKEG